MHGSLVDAWCPEPHDAPITAAASDVASGRLATADAWGHVFVRTADLAGPAVMLHHEARVDGALALSPGGSLLAVGDEAGVLAVYDADDGRCRFRDARPGPAGPARAMRALAFAPDGERVASLAADGRLRLVRATTGERLATYADLAGRSLDWDEAGHRIVALDAAGTPVVLDLVARQRIVGPTIAGGARQVRWVPGEQQLVVLAATGLFLIDATTMQIVTQRTADRSSGMLALLRGPEGARFAVISARSVHTFDVPGLNTVQSLRHGAPAPTGAAVWDRTGVAVGAEDGRLYRPDQTNSLPGTVCVSGIGAWRAVGHEHHVAIWQDGTRRRTFIPEVQVDPEAPRALTASERIVELRIDREGRVLALLTEDLPLQVYEADAGRHLFSAGPDTVDAPRFVVGTGVVAVMLRNGRLRWYDLRANRTFDLDHVADVDVTGGGTWLAVVTRQGNVRIIDPATGDDALPVIQPIGDTPIRLAAFVAGRPELLLLDQEGILGLVDLAPAARDGEEVVSWRIAALRRADVDQLWGLEDGRHAVVRVQEKDDTATFVTFDLDTGEATHEVTGQSAFLTLDAASGHILEPATGNAVLERGPDGAPLRVLRSLPGDGWVTFDHEGVRAASGGVRRALGDRRPPCPTPH